MTRLVFKGRFKALKFGRSEFLSGKVLLKFTYSNIFNIFWLQKYFWTRLSSVQKKIYWCSRNVSISKCSYVYNDWSSSNNEFVKREQRVGLIHISWFHLLQTVHRADAVMFEKMCKPWLCNAVADFVYYRKTIFNFSDQTNKFFQKVGYGLHLCGN